MRWSADTTWKLLHAALRTSMLRAAVLVALRSGVVAQITGSDGATGGSTAALANETSVANWGPLVPGAACSAAPSENVRYLHGAWMALSWSTFIAGGVFVARYCRHHPWWVTVHIRLMTVGSLGTAGFAAVAVAMVQPERQGLSTHHILGFTIGALTLAQASVGKYIHELQQSKRSHGIGRGLAVCHKAFGKLLLAVAAYEIWLGVDMLAAALTPLFLGWIAMLAAVFLVAEVRLRLSPPVPPAADDDLHGSAYDEARHAHDGDPPELELGTLELDAEEQMADSRSLEPRVNPRRPPLSRVPPPLSDVRLPPNGRGISSRVPPPPLNTVKRSA